MCLNPAAMTPFLPFLKSLFFLVFSFVAQTTAQNPIQVVPVQPGDVPHGQLRQRQLFNQDGGSDSSHGQLHHRMLVNLDGEIVVNGPEVGPINMLDYNPNDTNGTTTVYKTQTIPPGTQVSCQLKVNSDLSGGRQYIRIKGGSLPTYRYDSDRSDLCSSPSNYTSDCEVKYVSVNEEPFYVMVYGNECTSIFCNNDLFGGWVKCTANFPNFPTPLPTLPPTPVPTRPPTPVDPTPTLPPTPVPTSPPTPVPGSPTPPPTNPPVVSPTSPPPVNISGISSTEFFFPNVPANAEVSCVLSCDETSGDGRILYTNFGSPASSADFDAVNKGGCPVITTATAPDGCDSSDLYIRVEVKDAESTVTNGNIRCNCDACDSCWNGFGNFFRGIRSQVGAYWGG